MKKVYLILMLVLIALSSVNAQFFNKTDVKIYENNVADQARDLVQEHLDLTPEQAKIFWPLYDEYRAVADSILDKEISILEKYLIDYYDLNEAKAKRLMAEELQVKRAKLDLEEKYFDIMSQKLPAQLIGKFFQIDYRLNLMINQQRTEKTPLVRNQDKK